MRKIKWLICGLLISTVLFASEQEDINFLDGLFKSKKYSLALKESNNFILKYPKSKYSKNIKLRMGQLYYIEGKYNEAAKVLNNNLKELKLNKDESNDMNVYLVKSYVGLKKFDLAKSLLIKIDENADGGKESLEEAVISIGRGYMESKLYEKAQEELLSAINIQGENYDEVVLNLALSTYNNREYTKTINYLNQYYRGGKFSKNSDVIIYIYGSSYSEIGKTAEALNYYNIIKDNDSLYGMEARSNLINIHLKQDEEEEALNLLPELYSNENIYNKSLKNIGNFYLIKKMNEKALEYYDRITEKNASVRYGVAVAQYRLKDYEKALENFKNIQETAYKKESIFYQLSIEYINKNYNWIIENRALIEGLNLKDDEKIGMNNIIGNSAFQKNEFQIAKEYYLSNYKMNSGKESHYKLILTLNRLKESDELNKLILDYNEKYPLDKENGKNIAIINAGNFLNQNQGDKAIAVYESYLALTPDKEILETLIELMISQQKYVKALEYLNKQEPSMENTYQKGLASMGMGKYSEASEYFNRILSNEVEVKEELRNKTKYNQIKNSFLWGKYEEVQKLGENYILNNIEQNKSDVIDKVAISYFRVDNMEKAREYFEKLKTNPNTKNYAEFQIAETYYSEKKYEEAIKAYRLSFENSKNKALKEKSLYWEISSLYLTKNNEIFELRVKEFLEKYQNSKLIDNVLLMSGKTSQTKGELKNSLKAYEDLFNKTKNRNLKDEALKEMIRIYQQEKNDEKELESIKKLISTDEKSYYLANYYKKRNNILETKSELEKLLQSEKYKDYSYVELGNYAYNSKEYQLALEYYEKIVALESSLYKDKALYKIAITKETIGDINEAITNYTKLYILYPQSPYALESKIKVGEGYEKLEKNTDAVAQYEDLLQSESKNREYLLEKLIYLNLKMKKESEAKKYYETLKKENKTLSEKYKNYFVEENNI